ncbi:MAG: hypothetical protein M1831_006539 [Alyxoria varia]|nr:MAG: hypothetical protein M1831_006539 [Alyxoria varia]
MKRTTKFTLNGIFLLGLLTACLSIARAATTNSRSYAKQDVTYTSMIPGLMSAIEEKLGIFFASAPMLRQFTTYVSRRRTFLPSTSTDSPAQMNGDFLRMRRKIRWRDVFWYRPLDDSSVGKLYPKTGGKMMREPTNEDKEVRESALDRVWKRIGRAFGGNVKPEDGLPVEPAVATISDSAGSKSSGSRADEETKKPWDLDVEKSALVSAPAFGSSNLPVRAGANMTEKPVKEGSMHPVQGQAREEGRIRNGEKGSVSGSGSSSAARDPADVISSSDSTIKIYDTGVGNEQGNAT